MDAASQLQAALEHNPDLEKARLAITLADLNIVVAKNQALPRLDLTGSLGYSGMAGHHGEAHENLGTMDFVDYSVGLAFEYPPGNRERLAEVERRRLERLKSVAQLQSVADQIAFAVKERVREVERTYEEIGLQRQSAEALRRQLQALEDIEKIRGKLTPEFLNLKLNAQSTLADTRIAELRTIRAYNQALAELARATGTILKEHQVDILLPAAAGQASWPEREDRPSPATGRSSTQSTGQEPRRVWSGARLQAPD
jgi:outer membrane protein TolC